MLGEPKGIRAPHPLAGRTQLGPPHTQRPAGAEAWGPLGDPGMKHGSRMSPEQPRGTEAGKGSGGGATTPRTSFFPSFNYFLGGEGNT